MRAKYLYTCTWLNVTCFPSNISHLVWHYKFTAAFGKLSTIYLLWEQGSCVSCLRYIIISTCRPLPGKISFVCVTELDFQFYPTMLLPICIYPLSFLTFLLLSKDLWLTAHCQVSREMSEGRQVVIASVLIFTPQVQWHNENGLWGPPAKGLWGIAVAVQLSCERLKKQTEEIFNIFNRAEAEPSGCFV